MDYFEKLDTKPDEDLSWNIPEQKQGSVNIIGGSLQNFRTEIKTAEFLSNNYPLKEVRLILPDTLKNKLPPLPNFTFVPATESGSMDDSQMLRDVFNASDFNLVLGDLSKNAITSKAITGASATAEKMTLLTRDTVDLAAENEIDKLLMNENIILLATMPQLLKIFRAVYYPKMLLLSEPLMQVAEALHKFTLSYPVSIVTLNEGQILVASEGIIKAVALERTGYSALTLWNGELAAKIVAINIYTPNSFIKATSSVLFE